MTARRDVCHCGCDRASHYRDLSTGVFGACLVGGCDCANYVHVDDHDTVRLLKRPVPRDTTKRTVKTTAYSYYGPYDTTTEHDPAATCKGGDACRCFAP